MKIDSLSKANWIRPHEKSQMHNHRGYEIETALDPTAARVDQNSGKYVAGTWSWVAFDGAGGSEDGSGYATRAQALEAAKRMVEVFVSSQETRRLMSRLGADGIGSFKAGDIEVWINVKDYDREKKYPPLDIVVNYPDGRQDDYYWRDAPKRKLNYDDVKDFLRGKGVKLVARLRRIDTTKDVPAYVSPDVLSRAYMKLEKQEMKKSRTFREVSREIRAAGTESDKSQARDKSDTVKQKDKSAEQTKVDRAAINKQKEPPVPKEKSEADMKQDPKELLD